MDGTIKRIILSEVTRTQKHKHGYAFAYIGILIKGKRTSMLKELEIIKKKYNPKKK